MRRSARKEDVPDLGILATQFSARIQRELYARAAEQGFEDARPRHGAVIAFLDAEGTRPMDLARLAGRSKQTMGAILDELERLGYVRREPDPADRRARLIVPTDRGLRFMEVTDALMADIERDLGVLLGVGDYDRFKAALRRSIDALPPAGRDADG